MTVTGLIAFALLICVLVPAVISDVRRGMVPNYITYPGALAGLAIWAIHGRVHAGNPNDSHGFLAALFAMLCGFVPCFIIYRLGGFGGGDIKLTAAVGAIGGHWEFVLGVAFYGVIAQCIAAVFVMIRRRIVLKTLHQLWGALLSSAARVKPVFSETSPRLPVAVFLLVGGLLAGAEHLLGLRLPWSAG